MVVHPS